MEEKLEAILTNIKTLRKKKGYSHEVMGIELQTSQAAYSKLEKGQTKLTVERLYQIAEVLDEEVGEILGIQAQNQFNQSNRESVTAYLQQTAHFHQANKEQSDKIAELYEAQLAGKDVLINELKGIIQLLKA